MGPEILSLISGLEGKVKAPAAEPKVISLAYPIKKEQEATLNRLAFEMAGEKIAALKEALNLNPAVLRYLIRQSAESRPGPKPVEPATSMLAREAKPATKAIKKKTKAKERAEQEAEKNRLAALEQKLDEILKKG